MPLSRKSKVKDALKSPAGHEMLHQLARQLGKPEAWLRTPFVAGMPLHKLDKLAGAGFCDGLLEMAGHVPEGEASLWDEGKGWWKEAVVYRIFLPSFMDSDHDGVGDLGGVTQRLPYLERLGVTALWLWPVAQVDTHGNVTDHAAVHPESGTRAQLQQLVQAAHGRGMKVMISLEVAATSEQHVWLREKPGAASYHVLRQGEGKAPPNNWHRAAGGPAWKWLEEQGAWALRLNGKNKLDLNWDSAQLRRTMAEVLAGWQGLGIDGFYLGPVGFLSKSGYDNGAAATPAAHSCGYEKYAFGPRLHRYLREVRAAVPAPGLLVGELRGVGMEMACLFTPPASAELDWVLDSTHLSARLRPRTDEVRLELLDLRNHYLKWQSGYGAQHWMPLFFEGPRTGRIVSRLGASPLYRTILAKLLGTWMLTLRGTPIVYQGQELGLPGARYASPEELQDEASLQTLADWSERLQDPTLAWQQLAPHLAQHTLLPMPWGPGPGAGFSGAAPWIRPADGADYLNAATQMEDGASVWRHYQRLIELRRQSDCLVYGRFNAVFVKNKKVFCYFRILDTEKWYVELNITEREVPRPGRISASQVLVLSNYDTPARTLRPYEANLYRCD